MSAIQTLPQALEDWSHVFMRRSMSALFRYARESGVSMQQFGALFYLQRRGNCGVSDIGEDLGVTNAAASQMIDRLVQQGLLERNEDPHDRRGKQILLSTRGKEFVGQVIIARQNWIEEINQALTPEQQGGIIVSLNLLTEVARKLERETVTDCN